MQITIARRANQEKEGTMGRWRSHGRSRGGDQSLTVLRCCLTFCPDPNLLLLSFTRRRQHDELNRSIHKMKPFDYVCVQQHCGSTKVEVRLGRGVKRSRSSTQVTVSAKMFSLYVCLCLTFHLKDNLSLMITSGLISLTKLPTS